MARSGGGDLVEATFGMVGAAASLFLLRFLLALDSGAQAHPGRVERIATHRNRIRIGNSAPRSMLVYPGQPRRGIHALGIARGAFSSRFAGR